MTKITISRDNTTVSKLHNLASNSIFDKRTVKKILEISGDSELVFSSEYAYNKFKDFEFSMFANFSNKQLL